MGSDTEAVILIDTGTISILVPRMGSDHKYSHSANIVCNFNSRSPYGELLSNWRSLLASRLFQFTLPAWGAMVVGFSYDFILLLLFIPANQEKVYFFACFFGFFLWVAYGSRCSVAYTFLSMVTLFGKFSVSIVTS